MVEPGSVVLDSRHVSVSITLGRRFVIARNGAPVSDSRAGLARASTRAGAVGAAASVTIQRVLDRVEDVGDVEADPGQQDDRDDRDERADQDVLDERLTLLSRRTRLASPAPRPGAVKRALLLLLRAGAHRPEPLASIQAPPVRAPHRTGRSTYWFDGPKRSPPSRSLQLLVKQPIAGVWSWGRRSSDERASLCGGARNRCWSIGAVGRGPLSAARPQPRRRRLPPHRRGPRLPRTSPTA